MKQFNKKKNNKKVYKKNFNAIFTKKKKDYFHEYILNMFIVNLYNNIYIDYIIY